MEMSQGSSLEQTKMLFLILLQNQRTRGQNRSFLGWGGWYQWEEEDVGKGHGRYVNGKKRPVETTLGIGGEIKEIYGAGEYKLQV
jgi:hypothetical protein